MTTTNKKRNMLALFLSVGMATSLVAGLSACSKTKEAEVDDSKITITETDKARIKNGSFKFVNDNDGKNLIVTSLNNWTSSTASGANSSSVKSGIVNTSAWDKFSETDYAEVDVKAWKDEIGVKDFDGFDAWNTKVQGVWEHLSLKQKLTLVKAWKDASKKVADLKVYDKDNLDLAFETNILATDIPDCDSPLTHYTEDDKDSHVLMIHNSYKKGDSYADQGTAQYYTSSSTITLEAGTSAQFSVWVKTQDLKFTTNNKKESQDNIGSRGAYISITNTVGGKTLDPIVVNNIDTELMNPTNENNGWMKYSFTLKGATYSTSTFTVNLGLGEQGEMGYVSGYAFFDDVECTVLKSGDPDVVSAETGSDKKIFATDEKNAKKIDAFVNNTVKTVFIDLAIEFNNYAISDTIFTLDETKTTKYGKDELANITASKANDITKVYTSQSALESDATGKALANFTDELKFPGNNMLLLYSESGTPYTAKLKPTEYIEIAKDEYYVISFFVKTSDFSGGYTGASVKAQAYTKDGSDYISDGSASSILSSVDTTNATAITVDTGDDKDDIYSGWKQCFVFLTNESDDTRYVELSFTYGPTDIVNANNTTNSYCDGYVAYANFEYASVTKDVFSRVSTGSYVSKLTYSDTTATGGYDETVLTNTGAIETGYAIPQNNKGVYGGSNSIVVGGTDGVSNAINNYAYAGLLATEYASNYSALSIPSEVFEGTVRPLVISANGDYISYGYIGETQSVAGGSTQVIGMKVFAETGSTATVYVIDTKTGEPMKVSANTTYYYNADGNVCDVAPTSKEYNKKTSVAFVKNNQGLYTLNTAWAKYETYKAEAEGKVYANLQNFAKDDDGNLIYGDKAHDYNYVSGPCVGNQKIAYYYKASENAYYLDKECTKKVNDLAEISDLAFNEKVTRELTATITGEGKWVNVWFVVETGTESKDYRVEVWAGKRTGEKTQGVVAFEKYTNELNVTANDLINEEKESNKYIVGTGENYEDAEDKFNHLTNAVYSFYSFYDSANYRRFDETVNNPNKVKFSYNDYDATATQTENTVFLTFTTKYSVEDVQVIYANFNSVDQETAVDVEKSNDNTDDNNNTNTDTTGASYNVWLLASSIILAVVLLLAIGSIVVRKIVKNHKKYSVK